MGKITVRYLVKRTVFVKKLGRSIDVYYWVPKPRYRINGQWIKCPFPALRLAKETNLPADATQEAEKWNALLDAWRKGLEPAPQQEGTFPWLISEYQKGAWFRQLAPRSQKEYRYILEAIRVFLRERGLEYTLAVEIDRQMARSLVHSFAATPRTSQHVAALSRLVFNYGIETGALKDNPFKDMRIRRNKPRDQIWLDVENPAEMFRKIIAFKLKAREMGYPSMALAMDLGLFSMQRAGDIRHLAWNKYDGTAMRLRQGKTSKWVYIPVTRLPVFKSILDAAPRLAPTMLIHEATAKPYTKDRLSHLFQEIKDAAGIESELQFRDLRRTGVVLWGMSGAEPQEVAAISGHTNAEVSNIMETYMPKNLIMAQNGMDKVNEKYGAQLKVIQSS